MGRSRHSRRRPAAGPVHRDPDGPVDLVRHPGRPGRSGAAGRVGYPEVPVVSAASGRVLCGRCPMTGRPGGRLVGARSVATSVGLPAALHGGLVEPVAA